MKRHQNGNGHSLSKVSRSLENLCPGASGRVAGIHGEAAMALSLMEIGLLPGALVKLIRRAPFGCPLEVSVGGARFSIRRDTARHVSLAGDD